MKPNALDHLMKSSLLALPFARCCLAVAIAALHSLAMGTEPNIKELLPTTPYGEYVSAVAVNNKYVLVGSGLDTFGGVANAGTVRVFDAVSGKQIRQFGSPTPASSFNFGSSVTLRGSQALVGSGNSKAYLYDLATNKLIREFIPVSGSASFSAAAAMDGTYVVLGDEADSSSRGAVYVFDQLTGVQKYKLTVAGAAANDLFGASLAISGGLLVVGAPGEATGTGGAYCYDLSSGQFAQKLIATDSATNRYYGSSVALSGRLAYIGSSRRDGDRGAIYVVESTTGVERDIWVHPNAQVGDSLGYEGQLAVSGNLLVAYTPVRSSSDGGVHFFDATTGKHLGNLAYTSEIFGGAALSLFEGRLALAGDYFGNSAKVFLASPVAAPRPGIVVAGVGDVAPASFGLALAAMKSLAISPTGTVLIKTGFTGTASNSGKDEGITNFDGDYLSGVVVKSRQSPIGQYAFSTFPAFVANQATQLLFRSPLINFGVSKSVNSTNNEGIFSGDLFSPLLRKGEALADFGNAQVATINQFVQSRETVQKSWAVSLGLKVGTAGVVAGTDSGLLVRSSLNVTLKALREGETSNNAALPYGQFTGRVSAMDQMAFSSALQGSVASNQAVFRQPLVGIASIVAIKGADGTFTGGFYSTFVGETISTTEATVYRATLSGLPVAQNEGLWSDGSFLVGKSLQAGVISGSKVTKILGFWAVQDRVLVHLQITGPGVTARNDSVLVLVQENGAQLTLMREGSPAAQCADGARIGAFQKIEVDPETGHYAVLASLTGAAADSNQALFFGKVTEGDAVNLTGLRLPVLAVRKGTRHLVPFGGSSNKILSINLPVNLQDASGAGTRGNARLLNSSGALVYELTFDNKVRQTLVSSF